jgi:hypothetical protein
VKKLLLLFMAAVTVGITAFAVVPAGADAEANNWFVCKYVGPPGSGEVLQGGNNPIFVDENAIDVSPVVVGATFGDAQTHSLVIAGPFSPNDKPDPEPTCPGETPPPTTTTPPPCPNGTVTVTVTKTVTVTASTAASVQEVPSCTVTQTITQTTTVPPPPCEENCTTTTTITTTPPPPPPTTTTTTTPPSVQPPPASCPGSLHLGPWYGDPQINIDLKGQATFVVSGGRQRFSGLTTITKTLACNETFRIGRYKVERGHYLTITQNGVVVTHIKPPRFH